MLPAIQDGDILHVEPTDPSKLKPGHIVLFEKSGGFKAHRIVRKSKEYFVTRGDAGMDTDGEVRVDQILGKVVAREVGDSGKAIALDGIEARTRFLWAQLRGRIGRLISRHAHGIKRLFLLALLVCAAHTLQAQIAVDSVSTGTQTASLTFSFSIPHTTSGSNRLMVVGVSMNTTGNVLAGQSKVSGITYNGSALSKILASEANGERVEMWYLAGPAVGAANVTITGTAGVAIGISAAVITFTGVEQTSPIRTSNSAQGSSTTAQVALAGVGNSDMVLDTLAVVGGTTVTTPSLQTNQWNVTSSGLNQVTSVGSTCIGSSCTGPAPNVTMSEGLGSTTNWTIGAIAIRAYQADMSITKIGSPEPVLENATLTYTLTITNNGPENATAVDVLDALPSQVSFVSVSSTQGVCTGSVSGASCAIGSMVSGATVTVTIVTTAVTPSLATNTATVTSATPDADQSNNTATFTSTIEYPTSVRINSFTAEENSAGALVSWNSGGELHNLGFNVYRDVNGEKTKLNPSLIAGSALLIRDTMERHAGKTYRWLDTAAVSGGLYWLEDVELSGARTMHGPITVESSNSSVQPVVRSETFAELASRNTQVPSSSAATAGMMGRAHVRQNSVRAKPTPTEANVGFKLAAGPAVKIFVDHEGWYRVTQPQLVAAGLRDNVESKSLHLYAEGVEQPIRVTGGDTFGPMSAIEFYGTGIDTPYSGQRVYWLVVSPNDGLRISDSPAEGSDGPEAQGFMQTLELKPRTTYFGTLLQDSRDDFFGPLVSPTPETETVTVSDIAQGDGTMTVTLQGLTEPQQHTVTVEMNGATLGELNFANEDEGRGEFQVPSGVLAPGTNTISLISQLGDNDLSLVDAIELRFPHTLTAESDMLQFTAESGRRIRVRGFSHPPTRLIDITNPLRPYELRHEVVSVNGSYAIKATVPWTTPGEHLLLALSDAGLATPAAITPHHPSNLHSVQAGYDYVILTASQFTDQVRPLAELHRKQGSSVALVSVDDVYDEFNFGERTPFAIRNFLQTATTAWKTKPHYLLLVGDASVDPRDYLGFGFFDFMPTRLVITAELMTASDDWFSDFDNTGLAKIATGRLPARTKDDAKTMVSKILSYEQSAPSGWNSQAMLVADRDDPTLSFTKQAQSVQKLLPQTMKSTDVFAGSLGTSTASQNLVNGINSGQLFVHYNGHGSVEVWSGGGLFNDTIASSLTNGQKLPVFVIMNCLNGFFQDVYTQSLAESLMLAPNGGAVAVWASSGLTAASPQFVMDRALAQTLFSQPATPLGDAVLAAKSTISDLDVRRTFILFGDPAMQVKVPANSPAIGSGSAPNVKEPLRPAAPGTRTIESNPGFKKVD